MKQSPLYSISMYQQELMAEEQAGLAMGMEVDDADSLEILGEVERQPSDADFFNNFEDDFDDSDI
ncbi:small acidic protein 1-like [Wolffia australiana]